MEKGTKLYKLQETRVSSVSEMKKKKVQRSDTIYVSPLYMEGGNEFGEFQSKLARSHTPTLGFDVAVREMCDAVANLAEGGRFLNCRARNCTSL